MELREAEKAARRLMIQHGVGRVKFAFDGGKRRLGACHSYTIGGVTVADKITLSKHYVPLLPEDEVIDVILHEIAHALTPGQGHNHVWKNAARKVGAKAERCATPSARPAHSIEGNCPKCEVKVSEHHRMPRATYVHRTCGTILTYVRL